MHLVRASLAFESNSLQCATLLPPIFMGGSKVYCWQAKEGSRSEKGIERGRGSCQAAHHYRAATTASVAESRCNADGKKQEANPFSSCAIEQHACMAIRDDPSGITVDVLHVSESYKLQLSDVGLQIAAIQAAACHVDARGAGDVY